MKELKDAHEKSKQFWKTPLQDHKGNNNLGVYNYKSPELQIRREVDRLKEMYRIAKKLKTLAVGTILSEIIKPGFEAACLGFDCLCNEAKLANLPEMKMYEDDMLNFATVGFKLTAMLYGKDNGITMEWQGKKDQIKYYKKLKENIHQRSLGSKKL